MPNSQYAATAPSDRIFTPRCIPGPYGARTEIDRRYEFEPVIASMAGAACYPRWENRAGKLPDPDPGKCGLESGLVAGVIRAGCLAESQSDDCEIRQAEDS